MNFRILLLILYIACLTAFVNGQATTIERDEYFSQMNVAEKKTESLFPRREIMEEETLQNGKNISRRRVTYEYSSIDANRHDVVYTKSGAKATTENYIQIGGNYFCKQGTSSWKKSTTRCEPVRMSVAPAPDQEEFTVEKVSVEGKENKVFSWYKTRISSDGTQYYSKQIFTVGSDGELIRSYREEGKVNTKQVDSTNTWTYEYGITVPKIEPPIK